MRWQFHVDDALNVLVSKGLVEQDAEPEMLEVWDVVDGTCEVR